jgi:hypothetical protein
MSPHRARRVRPSALAGLVRLWHLRWFLRQTCYLQPLLRKASGRLTCHSWELGIVRQGCRGAWHRHTCRATPPRPPLLIPLLFEVTSVRHRYRSVTTMVSEHGDASPHQRVHPSAPASCAAVCPTLVLATGAASMPGNRSCPQRSGTQIAHVIPVVNLDHLFLTD